MDIEPNIKVETIILFTKIKNIIKLVDVEGYKTNNSETKKLEPSIIIACGVTFYWLNDLILYNYWFFL